MHDSGLGLVSNISLKGRHNRTSHIRDKEAEYGYFYPSPGIQLGQEFTSTLDLQL